MFRVTLCVVRLTQAPGISKAILSSSVKDHRAFLPQLCFTKKEASASVIPHFLQRREGEKRAANQGGRTTWQQGTNAPLPSLTRRSRKALRPGRTGVILGQDFVYSLGQLIKTTQSPGLLLLSTTISHQLDRQAKEGTGWREGEGRRSRWWDSLHPVLNLPT